MGHTCQIDSVGATNGPASPSPAFIMHSCLSPLAVRSTAAAFRRSLSLRLRAELQPQTPPVRRRRRKAQSSTTMTGPERRGHEADRVEPYARPADGAAAHAHAPIPAPAAPSSGLDAATQAAIQAAAAAAAAAAIAQQQRAAQQQVVGAGLPLAAAPPATLPGAVQGFVKVSGQSDPRKVAGKLAHTCRDNPAPAMLTIGSNCINQAVKAICIARGYLADSQIELTFQTAFREGGTPDRPSVALYLSKHPNSRWQPLPGAVELSVSGSSQATVVAGALSARCRDNAPVCLIGIGVDAVTNAVMAIGHTRLHLEADGKDIRAWPEFVKVQKPTGELNAIKFHIHVDRLR